MPTSDVVVEFVEPEFGSVVRSENVPTQLFIILRVARGLSVAIHLDISRYAPLLISTDVRLSQSILLRLYIVDYILMSVSMCFDVPHVGSMRMTLFI